jgi:hypothetical protein
MKPGKWVILIAVLLAAIGCDSRVDPPENAIEVQMIFWESQSWETGGGRSRLTLWADGRSQVTVVPDAFFRYGAENLRLRHGWVMKQGRDRPYFVRMNVFTKTIAKSKFDRVVAAGIHLLETFKPGYVDGGGTLVGVQVNGELRTTAIPMFLDQHQGSANHRRFLAVSKVMSDFDRQAYDIDD